jgi:catechol 2,3-dioxygenase-like lactoylglutathione lyase family enzyme
VRIAHIIAEVTVTIVLNHTIVRSADKHAAAQFFAGLLGLEVGEPSGPFTPVRVNTDLTLDYDDRHPVVPTHFGFLIDDDEFDKLLGQLDKHPDVPFGFGPEHGWDRRTNHLAGGRGVYVAAPDGHSYEFFTVPPT